jgi:ABC-type transporter Mla subunit MlaD
MAAVSKGAGVVGSVAGGPSSMLSAMGPWGALVDAIVKAVTHFADLGDTFTQYTAEFNDALAKLPQTLMENLPRWLQEGTRSTFAMLPKLISTLVIEFFNPENWIKAAEGFIQGVSQGLTEGFSDYKAPSSQTGSFDLFGALGGSSGTSGGSSKSPDLFVKASDFWSDFTKAVDKETSAIGRAFA